MADAIVRVVENRAVVTIAGTDALAPLVAATQTAADEATAAQAAAEAAKVTAEMLTAQAQPLAMNTRVAKVNQRRKFVTGEIAGPYLATAGAPAPQPSGVVTDGALVISGAITVDTSVFRYWDIGARWANVGSVEINAKATRQQTTQSPGVRVAVGRPGIDGTPNRMVIFSYLITGSLNIRLADNTLVWSASVSALAWTTGVAALRVTIEPSGDITIVATSPTGAVATRTITHGTTTGVASSDALITALAILGSTDEKLIAPATIGSSAQWTMQELSIEESPARLATAEGRVALTETLLGVSTAPVLLDWGILGDATPNRFPRGCTSTGLSRFSSGPFAGCFAVGDDGRIVDNASPATPYVPRIHIYLDLASPPLLTIDPGYTGRTLQGVTAMSDGTIWAACGDRTLRHFEILFHDGTHPTAPYQPYGVEIAADRISYENVDGVALTAGAPNGLCAIDGKLIVGDESGTLYRFDPNPTASPRLLETRSIAGLTIDQFHAVGNVIFITRGNNGVGGIVGRYNWATQVYTTTVWSGLDPVQAIEGIHIDTTTRIMTLVSDGGFHVSAKPRLNLWAQFRVPESAWAVG